MYQAIIIIHILLGLSIIGLILMQQGKGADAGATFGGGASGSVFGAQGAASFLSRTTAILATLFFITSLGLAWINGNRQAASDFMSVPGAQNEDPVAQLPIVDNKASAKDVPSAPISAEKAEVIETPVVVENPAATENNAAVDKLAEPAVVEEKDSELKTEAAPAAAVEKKQK